jgi:type II secretory pathway component GspD/PulD (secretin)
MTRLLALLLILCLNALPARADSIATIELHNRPAEDLIPVISPMLGPDDSLTGQGFLLFLRAPPDTQRQVEQMVRSLDVAARMLLISVFQGSDRELRALGVDSHLRLEGNDTSVVIGNAERRHGGSDVSISTRNASAGATIASTRGRLQDSPVHRLRVTEGSEGYIETGQSIPYFSGARRVAPGEIAGGVDYKDVTTGFYVLPRIHGTQVTLQVSPFKQSLSRKRGGDIDTQSAQTTVTGPLGEWLPIGGVTEQTQQSYSGIGSYGSTRSRNNSSIWIKAEQVQ